MSFIEILKVLVLGIVEGFTEWLPISSTGHLILVDKIVQFKQPEEFVNMFKVVIQLGAILAVLVMYFHRLNPFSKRKKPSQQRATLRLWMKIVVACLPAAVFGLLLDDWIDAMLMDNAYVVSAMLILYGVLFIAVENRNAGQAPAVQKVGQISFQLALYIGLFQVLAMIPGTSRSGATIVGAMGLLPQRGGGILLLPGDPRDVRRQRPEDCEIFPGGKFFHRPPGVLSDLRHGGGLCGVGVLHQIPHGLYQEQ